MCGMWKPNGPRYYAKRIAQKGRTSNKKRWTKGSTGTEVGGLRSRSLEDYNYFFGFGLGKAGLGNGVIEALTKMEKKNQPLQILDDGAGDGRFLEELKTTLEQSGSRARTTALSLTAFPELEKRKQQKKIDEVHIGFAEFFVPKKPLDAIFSLFGSLQYVPPEIQKDHLLKFAFSLKRGGLLLIGFNPKRSYGFGFIRGLAKRGFSAFFYTFPMAGSFPSHVLIIKRDR